ncbi:glutamate racemase, partial [Mesorhizobium sp. Primo-B]
MTYRRLAEKEPTMTERPILMFDSGIGGLTVLREARV